MVALFLQVVARSDSGDNLLQYIALLHLIESTFVQLKLAGQRMISEHVADPSAEVATAQVSIRLAHIDAFEVCDEFAESMRPQRRSLATSEYKRTPVRDGHVDILLSVSNVWCQTFADRKDAEFAKRPPP